MQRLCGGGRLRLMQRLCGRGRLRDRGRLCRGERLGRSERLGKNGRLCDRGRRRRGEVLVLGNRDERLLADRRCLGRRLRPGSDDRLELGARGDRQLDTTIAQVRRQRAEVDGRVRDGEADVVGARRQCDDARRGRRLGRDDAVDVGVGLVIAQADERESGAERES